MDEFLLQMIRDVDEQCLLVERECAVLRKLLKPWPRKKQHSDASNLQEPLKKTECPKDDHTDVTPEEKVVIDQVNHLIGRAHKALKIKDKVLASEESMNSNLECDKPDNKMHLDLAPQSESKTSNVTANIPTSHRAGNTGKKISSKIQPKKESVQKNVGTNQSGSGSASHRSSTPTSSRTVTPSSLTTHSRPSSGRSKFTPVHQTAPFRTEVNTRVAPRRLNHQRKNLMSRPSQTKTNPKSQTSAFNTTKPLPRISRPEKDNKHLEDCSDLDHKEGASNSESSEKQAAVYNDSRSDASCEQDIQCTTAQASCESVGITTPSSQLCHNEEESRRTGNDIQFNNQQKGSVHFPASDRFPDNVEQSSSVTNDIKNQSQPPDSVQSAPGNEEPLFSLTDARSKVKLPSKLTRMVSENNALLEKCHAARFVKKVPDSDAAQKFVDRLVAQNEVSEEMWARVKARACLQSHSLVLASLESLHIDSLSASSPFEDVYRAKRLLEFNLSKFANCQEEADYFSRVQFKQVPQDQTPEVKSIDDEMKPLFSACGKDFLAGTNKAHDVTDRLLTEALSRSSSWLQLSFEKQLHLFHQRVMSLTEKEWWPVLQQNPEDSSVFQAVHALLTSSGEMLPSIMLNPYS